MGIYIDIKCFMFQIYTCKMVLSLNILFFLTVWGSKIGPSTTHYCSTSHPPPSTPARSGTEASAQSGTHSARSDAPGGCHDVLYQKKWKNDRPNSSSFARICQVYILSSIVDLRNLLTKRCVRLTHCSHRNYRRMRGPESSNRKPSPVSVAKLAKPGTPFN